MVEAVLMGDPSRMFWYGYISGLVVATILFSFAIMTCISF
jgi:hypothetical protein